MYRHQLSCVVTALVLASSPAFAGRPQTPPDASSAARVQGDGPALFVKTCRVCHGEAGIGAVAPALRGPKFTATYVADVMRAGRPGTMMPSFTKGFTPAQIGDVAKYVAALQQPAGGPGLTLKGDPANGERLFFGSAVNSCHRCHSFDGRGAKVVPNLSTRLGPLSPREVLQRIVVVPHRRTDPQYVTTQIRTKGGLLMNGVKAAETANEVHFYDTATLPPVLHVIRKSEIVQTSVRSQGSVMPADYATRLSLQQLLDLVTFLKKGSSSSAITLADLINVQ
jgi:putative heme-binding domain-containing protein